MMPLIVDAFAVVLGGGSPPVVAAGRVGSRRPIAPGDLPAIVITVAVDAARERWPRNPDRDRYAGVMALDVWAASATETDTIARKLQQRVHDGRNELRAQGFASCTPSALEALEDVRQQPASGSPFNAFRQRIAFRFAFESTLVPIDSDGGPIKQIDVALGPTPEQMRIS
jgi:hypothetical protein